MLCFFDALHPLCLNSLILMIDQGITLGENAMGSVQAKEKIKPFAEESAKTRKAREKLKKKLEALEKKITPQALEKKTIEIHRWIARHASQRTVLRSKNISLFDENQNTADLSKKVVELADQIKKEFKIPAMAPIGTSSLQSKKILQSLVASQDKAEAK